MSIRKRFSWRVLFLLLAFLIGAVILFQVFRRPMYRLFGDFMSPYLLLPTHAESLFANSVDKARSKEELLVINQNLKAENERLKNTLSNYHVLKNNLDDLRKTVNLPPMEQFKYVTGQVVLRDPTVWDSTLTINVGRIHGVEPGAPVLVSAPQREGDHVVDRTVIIGRVDGVSRRTAQVNTLFHPSSQLSVFLPAARLVGVLSGCRYADDARVYDLKYLDRNASVGEGEPVYTSGLSPLTPEGILVGYLMLDKDGALKKSDNGLDARALVRPAADISYLRYVMIPIPLPPPAE